MLSLIHSEASNDLPILREKPSYSKLTKTLISLEVKPKSWDVPSSAVDTETWGTMAVSKFLLSIISSDLGWFHDDEVVGTTAVEQRENLWELASKRLAERCGRSAMPEISRTWVIPASANLPELRFEIREPPLTGDNLGFKTWGTAYTIAKKLEVLGTNYLGHLFHMPSAINTSTGDSLTQSNVKVLELGSGTGLVGIAAAAVWRTSVTLTDLPEIQANLQFNIQKNVANMVEPWGGDLSCEVLDWKNSQRAFDKSVSSKFKIVIASDSLYDDEHPELVGAMIKKYLDPSKGSRALVAIPLRDRHTALLMAKFRDQMVQNGFHLCNEGEEICRDDWDNSNGNEGVICWWGIWSLLFQSDSER